MCDGSFNSSIQNSKNHRTCKEAIKEQSIPLMYEGSSQVSGDSARITRPDTKLQSAHDDEARDIQKYRMLAFEALNAVKGPLGMAVNGELSAISAQENSHREMLSTIINALQEYRRQS